MSGEVFSHIQFILVHQTHSYHNYPTFKKIVLYSNSWEKSVCKHIFMQRNFSFSQVDVTISHYPKFFNQFQPLFFSISIYTVIQFFTPILTQIFFLHFPYNLSLKLSIEKLLPVFKEISIIQLERHPQIETILQKLSTITVYHTSLAIKQVNNFQHCKTAL